MRRQSAVWFMSLIWLSSLAGCRTVEGSRALDDLAPKKSVLLVGFGGWNSCRLQTDPNQLPTVKGFLHHGSTELEKLLTPRNSFTFSQLTHLAETLKAGGVDVTWMSTCFSVGTPKSQAIWFLDSSGASGTVPSLGIVERIKEAAAGRELILIGHSYGGWMAATVASQIDRPVLATYTLEAISGEECPQFAAVTGTTGAFPYCRKAPDGGSVSLPKGEGNSPRWTNIFLDPVGRDLDIFSGPYPAPIINVTLAYKNIDKGPFSNAHHLLGLGKATWDVICQSSAAAIGVAERTECRSLVVDRWGRVVPE